MDHPFNKNKSGTTFDIQRNSSHSHGTLTEKITVMHSATESDSKVLDQEPGLVTALNTNSVRSIAT